MAIKRMLEIKLNPEDEVGDLIDLWEFRSIQRADRYNEDKMDMDYLILINKNAIGTNFNDLEIVFPDKESRDAEIARIKYALEEDEDIIIM